MKLEDQVCSLELAKKLKELGLEKESLFYWVYSKNTKDAYLHSYLEEPRGYGNFKQRAKDSHIDDYSTVCYSAFTVAELGNFLGHGPFSQLVGSELCGEDDVWKNNRWICSVDTHKERYVERANTEANARAKMLIYLIEKGIVKL